MPEPAPRPRPAAPVTTPHPVTQPPISGEPIPIHVFRRFGVPVVRPRSDHFPIPVFDDPCYRCGWVRIDEMPCGGASFNEVPTIVLEETTQWSDEDKPARATYYFGPGFARLQYEDVDLIVDVAQQLVARIHTRNDVWQVQDVADWQAYVDSAATVANFRLSPRWPKFADSKTHEVVAGFRSQQFTAFARTTDDEGTRLLVENNVWVTNEMELTREMYAAYRLALHLFDGRCIDLPADRPDGIILRSRLSWHPIKESNHDNDLVEDSVVESVRYELVPRAFFDIQEPRGSVLPDHPPESATRVH